MGLRLFICLVILGFVNGEHSGCYEPRDEGACDSPTTKYYFNASSGTCEKFIYKGCKGNSNKYDSVDLCTRACVCSLPRKPGPCMASFPRYFFNITSRTCEEFFYGGCGGNHNNFATWQECQHVCLPYCNLPADSGSCRAHVVRYYYNPLTRTCEKFFYGGCRGNANNFKLLAECEKKCRK